MTRRREKGGGDKPATIGEALKSFLRVNGLEERVDRASVTVEWSALVGPQIARVTEARMVTDDGTLFVGVKTSGWMQELSMMERSLLARINEREGREPVRRIRWELLR